MPMGTFASLPEMDAAQALLELQGEIRPQANELNDGTLMAEEMEKSSSAAMFLSTLVMQQAKGMRLSIPVQSTAKNQILYPNPSFQLHTNVVDPVPHYMAKRRLNVSKRQDPPCKRRLLHNSRNNNLQAINNRWSKIIENNIQATSDKGTQTEFEYQLPQIEKMESIIKDLCTKIEILENKLKIQRSNSSTVTMDRQYFDENFDESSNDRIKMQYVAKALPQRKRSIDADWDVNKFAHIKSDEELREKKSERKIERFQNLKTKQKNYSNSDLVPIGDGYASIPNKILKSIDWSSYTTATRKLLKAVFPRSVLATSSLTGKPSPAFPNKPAKKQLDIDLVNDIIQTVVDNCRVTESVVRTCITTKCADESKMFRNSLQNKNKSDKKENIAPPCYTADDSDESYLST